MIKRILISNYALIKNVVIDFNDGFTAISGETGAGKSIILDAISLLCGNRSMRNVILHSNEKCVLELTMILSKKNTNIFTELEIDYRYETVIRREINTKGISRLFINDSLVSLNCLNIFMSNFIEIYSQNQSISLRKPEVQLNLLDQFSSSNALLGKYRSLLSIYNDSCKDLIRLKESSSISLSEIDYMRFQIDEIDSANLVVGEKKILNEEIFVLNNASEFLEVLRKSNDMLSEENGVVSKIYRIENQIDKLALSSDKITLLKDRLMSVRIELDDVSDDLIKLVNNVDTDSNLLVKKTNRLDLINNLLSKHRMDDIDELINYSNKLKDKISNNKISEKLILDKENELDSLKKDLLFTAKALSVQRHSVCAEFKKLIESHLTKLGIKYPQFNIIISKVDEFTDTGVDHVEFYFSANKGSEAKSLSKIASGGELSRIMLCISYIISQYNNVKCIFYDEIDIGVSGEIADLVSKMMMSISKSKQVISITHLPQIAAKANSHLKVYKNYNNSRTYTNIVSLDVNGRIDEISKMLSGEVVLEGAIKNAKELLNL